MQIFVDIFTEKCCKTYNPTLKGIKVTEQVIFEKFHPVPLKVDIKSC